MLLLVLLLEKKLRLKRFAALFDEGELLLGLLWRSGSCISPCNALLGNWC